MPTDPARLAELMRDAIASTTKAYTDGGSLAAYEKAMSAIITRGHMAGWIAGNAEKSAGGKVQAWLSKFVGGGVLSKAQRAEIKELVNAQLTYFKDFAGEAGDMSPEGIAARAGLYAGAVRGSYYKSATEDDLPCYPGGCPDCLSNCRCTLDVKDGGVYWQCADDDRSCAGCVSRGNDWTPYKK